MLYSFHGVLHGEADVGLSSKSGKKKRKKKREETLMTVIITHTHTYWTVSLIKQKAKPNGQSHGLSCPAEDLR